LDGGTVRRLANTRPQPTAEKSRGWAASAEKKSDGNAILIKAMKKSTGTGKQFVICIDNSGYSASLALHKVYAVLPDERAAVDDFLRVVDESGEDYLYSAKRFVSVELPQKVKQSWGRRVRESTMLANKTLQPTSRARHKPKAQKSPRAARGWAANR
jgi:hypothetical protein